jgi:hypothetical protein
VIIRIEHIGVLGAEIISMQPSFLVVLIVAMTGYYCVVLIASISVGGVEQFLEFLLGDLLHFF